MAIFIELDQLSEQDFISVIDNGKLEIKVKPTILPIESYTINAPADNIATVIDLKLGRNLLQVQGNFGILHLDFICKISNLGVDGTWRLPDDSPTPKALIQTQTTDGGTIWIAQGSRVIRWFGLTSDSRYIVNLIGFWE